MLAALPVTLIRRPVINTAPQERTGLPYLALLGNAEKIGHTKEKYNESKSKEEQ